MIPACIFQAYLPGGEFHGILFVILNHLPAPEGLVITGTAIDCDPYLDILTMAFLGGTRKRGLHCLKYNVLGHALFIGHDINDHENFFIHNIVLSDSLPNVLKINDTPVDYR